jgi:glycosyltransferase involved in cell wall biosynthesis
MPYPLTDGGAIGIYNITKSLAELGHRITLVTYPLDTQEATDEAVRDLSRFAAVRLVSRPLPARWKVLVRTLFRGAYPIERRMMPEMFELLREVVQNEKFDIVHVDHAHMGPYGLWLKQEFGLPIVLREHNFESLIYERFAKTEKNPVKRWIARLHGRRIKIQETKFLKQFDGIAAISREDEILMREVAPEGHYTVIPAGVDIEYFQPSQVPVDPNNITWVGSLAWDPNFDAVRHFLSDILPKIFDRVPGAYFNIIGFKGERVEPYIGQFGPKIHILGLVPDIRDYLAHSAVLVVPLRIGGGMRLKLLEFFSSAKAVVSTSIGAEGSQASNGVELLLREDDDSFADAVIALLADASLRASLGNAGRELVVREYSWQKIGEAFIAFYKETRDYTKVSTEASAPH